MRNDPSPRSGTVLMDKVSGDFNLSPPSLPPRTPEVLCSFSHSNMRSPSPTPVDFRLHCSQLNRL